MNSNIEDEQLDDLLSEWAGQCTSAKRMQSLHDRIVSSLQQTKSIATTDVVPQVSICNLQHHVARSHWASRFAVGTVVTMLLTVGFVLPRWDQPAVSSTSELPPEYAWLQAQQIQNKSVLLAEMESLFDNQLAWMAETGDQLEFGLDRPMSDYADRSQDLDHMAVRVIVEHRQQGSTVWQLAWAMDVVSRNEELVRVTPKKANGHELQIWTYRLPDGTIAVESELRLAETSSVRTQASGLYQNTKPVMVTTAQHNGTEYRVFQAVAMLDGRVI